MNIKASYAQHHTLPDGSLEVVFKILPERRRQALTEIEKVKHFKSSDLRLRVSQYKQQRSLAANNYCWALCTEIAKAVSLSKEDVYRDAIKHAGEYEPLPIKTEALDNFKAIWQSRGDGWIVEKKGQSKLDGYTTVFAYYGSSCYDKAEMKRLLDYIVMTAQNLNITIISDRERSLLIEDWEGDR